MKQLLALGMITFKVPKILKEMLVAQFSRPNFLDLLQSLLLISKQSDFLFQQFRP